MTAAMDRDVHDAETGQDSRSHGAGAAAITFLPR